MTTPMPSPNGTNRAGLYLPWPANPAGAYDAMPPRLARDESLDSNDVLSLFKILLSGIDPAERDAFTAQLQDLLDAGGTETEAPDKRTPGADRRLAHDRLPAGLGSFAERFPNASRVIGEASRRTRTY
jgi:hypothetical protein